MKKPLNRKGIVGIEAAIVMIAFVIVAAALAFVVLNMGFFTTQQTRQVIQRGLGQSASALEVDGTLVANVDVSQSRIQFVYVPIKLSTGQYVVDLTPGKSIVAYWSPQRGISIANTYLAAILTPIDTPQKLANITKALINEEDITISGRKGEVKTYYATCNEQEGCTINIDEVPGGYKILIALPDDVDNDGITLKDFFRRFTGGEVVTVMAWLTKINEDIVLDPGEKVLMLTYYSSVNSMPQSYDIVKFEIRVPIGAPLTIERSVPPSLTQGVVDLG
ncbi:MAG: archaellin/type IV pilin N-terminal domain-containing protein [Ignisphaera sp.]